MDVTSYDFLNEIPLFQGITQDQMIDVLRMLRPISFQPGELIFREGDVGLAAFVIQSGAVEIFIQAQPSAVVVARLQEGEIFGELALIDGSTRSAGARAITACDILCIEKKEFDYLRSQLRPVAFHLLRRFSDELCARIRDTNEQIDQILVSGKNVKRGGAIVTSARITPIPAEKPSLIQKWVSLFKN